MMNIGDSEGSCLMILKAICEFKLFGSSASVASSFMTNVSRNQGQLPRLDNEHYYGPICYL